MTRLGVLKERAISKARRKGHSLEYWRHATKYRDALYAECLRCGASCLILGDKDQAVWSLGQHFRGSAFIVDCGPAECLSIRDVGTLWRRL